MRIPLKVPCPAKGIGHSRRWGLGRSATDHPHDHAITFIQAFENFGENAVTDADFDLHGIRFGLLSAQHIDGALHAELSFTTASATARARR